MSIAIRLKAQFDRRDDLADQLNLLVDEIYPPLILMAIRRLRRGGKDPSYFGRFYPGYHIWESLEELRPVQVRRATEAECLRALRRMAERGELAAIEDISGNGYYNLLGS